MASRRRGRETARDMVLSLGLVLVVIVVAVTVRQHRSVDPVRVVDYTSDVDLARSKATYPVLAPAGLPARWRPTSSRATLPPTRKGPVALHIGFVTPKDEYAALEESDTDTAAFVADQTGATDPIGTVDVAGQPWQQYRNRRGELSLTRQVGPAVVVVTGSAALPELQELAASLR